MTTPDVSTRTSTFDDSVEPGSPRAPRTVESSRDFAAIVESRLGHGSCSSRTQTRHSSPRWEVATMKRFVGVTLAMVAVVLLAGVAFAQMGGGMGMGPGMMGGGMGSGMMGGGPANCPGMAGAGQAAAPEITAEKAKGLAEEYAQQHLPGFTVERVLPFTGMHRTMYQAELKGPAGETRALHISPWGNVMPHGTVTR
jgi:hypothetical protein